MESCAVGTGAGKSYCIFSRKIGCSTGQTGIPNEKVGTRACDKRSRKRRRMYGSEESDDNWKDQEAFRGIAEDPELDRMIDNIYIPELGVRPIFGTGFNKNRTLQRNAQAQRDSERYWASCGKT